MSKNQETITWKVKAIVRKWRSEKEYEAGADPYEVLEREHNLLLNEGIAELLDLLIGAGGGEVVYNNVNARLGVGNSNVAVVATQTALQGGSTLFKAMDATFPTRAAQTLTFRSTFASGDANFAWEEWSIDNGVARNRNLNRKAESLGTKVAGAVWELTVTVSIS